MNSDCDVIRVHTSVASGKNVNVDGITPATRQAWRSSVRLLSYDAWLVSERVFPEPVGDDDDAAAIEVGGEKGAALLRLDAEQREQIDAGGKRRHRPRRSAARQRLRPPRSA
jgi:hypothetical protein